MNSTTKLIAILAFSVIHIGVVSIAQETRTWLGNTSDWHDPANWLPFGVPGGQDDVIHENNGQSIMLGGSSTTGVDTFLMTGGGRLFTDGATLTVNDFNDAGWLRIIGNGSELIVEPSVTASADVSSDSIELESGATLRMQGGSVRVDKLLSVDSTSRISGFGNIEILDQDSSNPPTVVTVDGTISASGGALVILTESDSQVDFGTADLDAGFGDLLLNVSLSGEFEGNMTIGQGNVVLSDRPFEFGNNATLNMFGGDEGNPALFRSEETDINGRVNVDGSAVFSGTTTFRGSAEVELSNFDDELRLTGSESVVVGNSLNPTQPTPSFSGAGRVVNDAADGMLLVNSPVFDATVVNRSTLNLATAFFIGFEVGNATFNNFAQTETGILLFDIGINSDGDVISDTYTVNGIAEISGRLEIRLVDLNNLGLPELNEGDSFEIINSSVGIFGTFDEVIFPDAPDGAYWLMSYESDVVRATLVDFLLGDVNGDGSFDLLDVQPFVAAITNNIFAQAADVNQDGVVDLLDVEPFVNLLVS